MRRAYGLLAALALSALSGCGDKPTQVTAAQDASSAPAATSNPAPSGTDKLFAVDRGFVPTGFEEQPAETMPGSGDEKIIVESFRRNGENHGSIAVSQISPIDAAAEQEALLARDFGVPVKKSQLKIQGFDAILGIADLGESGSITVLSIMVNDKTLVQVTGTNVRYEDLEALAENLQIQEVAQ